jgi:transcriptional regulator with XRE-family HTH domain
MVVVDYWPGKQGSDMHQKLLPNKMRVLLTMNGITRKGLSEKLGVHWSMVSRWVSGESRAPCRQIKAIAKEFGISPSEIVDSNDLGILK